MEILAYRTQNHSKVPRILLGSSAPNLFARRLEFGQEIVAARILARAPFPALGTSYYLSPTTSTESGESCGLYTTLKKNFTNYLCVVSAF